MKIVLAAVGFLTNNIEYNKNKIISLLKKYSKKAELVVFGESFLQGFECLKWNYEIDKKIALDINDESIIEIINAAKKYKIAVSFGYIEKEKDKIYSSQITISKEGNIINNYRRLSKGWKEKIADYHYSEGIETPLFYVNSKIFSIGLCGDFWYTKNTNITIKMNLDAVLWPVYTDYNSDEWNNIIKYEYAEQASKIASKVLLVNSVCLDYESNNLAKGGAIYFKDGKIISEVKSGKENNLEIEI